MGDEKTHIRELLEKSWEGEIVGQVFFQKIGDLLPDNQPSWDLIARLESTMLALVEPVARTHGATLDELAVTQAAKDLAVAVGATGRDGVIDGTLAVIEEFLVAYRQLEGLLAPDDRWIGTELVAHELAFQHYLVALRHGDTDGDRPILEFLDRHQTVA
jgi:hypothetical protein